MKRFPKFSNLTVMKSAAGYYIGRYEIDQNTGNMLWPYDRWSGYFQFEMDAQWVLDNEREQLFPII